MAEPYLAEIRIFAGNFNPRSWAYCNGQLLAISSNQALFSLLGTIYGGDGRTTFGLPDLRGRFAIHDGGSTGPGLSSYNLGQKLGANSTNMTIATMANHNHGLPVTTNAASSDDPDGGILAQPSNPTYLVGSPSGVYGATTSSTGQGQAFSIIQPYQALNYIIALQGLFPSRN